MSPLAIGVVAYLFAFAVVLVFMIGMGRAAKRGDEPEDRFLAQTLERSGVRANRADGRPPVRPRPVPDSSQSADRRRGGRRIARPRVVH